MESPEQNQVFQLEESNIQYTLCHLHSVGYLKADLSKELGFEGMQRYLEKYLEMKDTNRKRLTDAPKKSVKGSKVSFGSRLCPRKLLRLGTSMECGDAAYRW